MPAKILGGAQRSPPGLKEGQPEEDGMTPRIRRGQRNRKMRGHTLEIQRLIEREQSVEGGGEVGLKGPSRRKLLEGLRNSLHKLLRHFSRGSLIRRVKKHLDHGLKVYQEDLPCRSRAEVGQVQVEPLQEGVRIHRMYSRWMER
jgi:hypothetical protein